MEPADDRVINTIWKHDNKVTSYEIALLRAINDIVLSFPNVRSAEKDVAVPLRMLTELCIAYYWPYADAQQPILQGQRSIVMGRGATASPSSGYWGVRKTV